MPFYFMPASVSSRIKDQMVEAQRKTDVEIYDSNLFQMNFIYSSQEKKAFDINDNSTFILYVKNADDFENLVPEKTNGNLNFQRVNNLKVIEKLKARRIKAAKIEK